MNRTERTFARQPTGKRARDRIFRLTVLQTDLQTDPTRRPRAPPGASPVHARKMRTLHRRPRLHAIREVGFLPVSLLAGRVSLLGRVLATAKLVFARACGALECGWQDGDPTLGELIAEPT